MNNMQPAYAADETTDAYTQLSPPTSPPLPSSTAAPNNPNDIVSNEGADPGENNHAAVVTQVINASGTDAVKRKRGRPRKNPVDGSMAQVPNSEKKPRGRPPGSSKKLQPVASGSPGAGFMPHVLDVKAGEDILAKLELFSQNSTRALCILSASGVISSVTLEQAATCGGSVTYEGRFGILSLSGSFKLPEDDSQCSKICGLRVALSGPNGRILAGNVAGLLTAASPVQVIVGSFAPASQQKQVKKRGSREAHVVNSSANLVSGSLSESSGGVPGSPVGQSNNSDPLGIDDMLWG